MSQPFFNRSHAIQGFEILCTVSSMLALIFVCTDATVKGKLEAVATGTLVMAAIFSVAAAVVARDLRAGLLAVFTGMLFGSSILCVLWLFSLFESPRDLRNWILFLTYSISTLVFFLMVRHFGRIHTERKNVPL